MNANINEQTENTEVEETENEELETEVEETESDEQESEDDESEDDEEKEEQPKKTKYEPWKNQKKEATSIPYSRFAEVNEDATRYRTEAEQLRQRLAQIEQQTQVQIKSPDEINPDDYSTVQDYFAARDKAVAAQVQKQVQETLTKQHEQQVQEQQQREHLGRYQANLIKDIQANPEVVDAVNYFAQHAGKLHPAVIHELEEDPNVGILVHDIVTDQDALDALFRASPAEALRIIHKRSAALELRGTSKTASKTTSKEAPKAMPKTAPRVVKQARVTYSAKDIENMPLEKYKKLRAAGKI